MRLERRDARVLVVGVGGLGCPALLTLVDAGVRHVALCDDDVVDRTNLHRQILFADADVGEPKLQAAARALRRRAAGIDVVLHETRLLPDNAVALVREADVVLEGSDNFATKFLVADACRLAGVPVVHASAVRWVGTAMAVGAAGGPCYRCLFEDVLPEGDAPNCAEAGVMGPVVGVVAAAQVDLALDLLDGRDAGGTLVTFDGRTGALRRRRVPRRPDCPLCGPAPRIRVIDPASYVSPACAS
jgi:molybdopterin/thiamine biosynthesis adenylyltransferase